MHVDTAVSMWPCAEIPPISGALHLGGAWPRSTTYSLQKLKLPAATTIPSYVIYQSNK
jgi:hypothetical protein